MEGYVNSGEKDGNEAPQAIVVVAHYTPNAFRRAVDQDSRVLKAELEVSVTNLSKEDILAGCEMDRNTLFLYRPVTASGGDPHILDALFTVMERDDNEALAEAFRAYTEQVFLAGRIFEHTHGAEFPDLEIVQPGNAPLDIKCN